jgi:hypothetical protein
MTARPPRGMGLPLVGPLARHAPRYYCVLMGHPFEGQFKKDTVMLLSDNPVDTVRVHNTRAVDIKETRHMAPYWRLLQAAGPFGVPEAADAVGQAWVAGTRGSPSKKRRGEALAEQYRLPFYSDTVTPPGGSTEAYLKTHAPRRYVRAYRAMRLQEEEEEV